MSNVIHGPDAGKPEIPLPSDRSVGVVFAGVAIAVAWFWRANPVVIQWALGSAAILAALAFLAPRVLHPLNIVWFRFGLLLHKVMNPVVMLALFAVAIVPAGLIMQRLRDPLRLKRPQDASYWIKIDQQQQPPTSMNNQF
jgi:hypothetical protein